MGNNNSKYRLISCLMPGTVLNIGLRIRAHCYLRFSFVIITLCNKYPISKIYWHKSAYCLGGLLGRVLAGFAHVSAVSWFGDFGSVLSCVCDS